MTTSNQYAAPGNRPRTALWVGAVALALLAGLAIGWLVLPHDAASPVAAPPQSTASRVDGHVGAPHGPRVITRGVPSGYTRDEAGAATAAVNCVQVQVNTAHGLADPATVKATWIARTADATARGALSQGRNTDGDDRTTKLPASRRVVEFTQDKAVVEVWVASVGIGTGIGGGTVTAQTWTTQTITLAWEDDWKVVSIKTRRGPEPGENGASAPALPTQSALYTFYVE
ncbi:hypothetical protein [Actinokineospora cianjurensis]|uniref:DUF8175 domain-containing protein n=1 Tax=Actinokineospora cianjurensis TaxID=585224 RepID=A0A421B249_9PSEU|nr:hypothetical protein [Actinokineospora cianjurensis]RLK58366.1 hypothetical protein CLV68_4464 [Actinokineospora cianjurensis]